MNNPILREMVANERYNDLLREAEQVRLSKSVQADHQARQIDLRAAADSLVMAVGHVFKVLARAV